MKRRGECRNRWGEGWLMAVLLALVLALSLAFISHGREREKHVLPIHEIEAGVLERAELADINTADAGRLAELPGVGEGLAARIIAYREENGPFSSGEDLLEVEGIGEAKLEAIRELIFVEARS